MQEHALLTGLRINKYRVNLYKQIPVASGFCTDPCSRILEPTF